MTDSSFPLAFSSFHGLAPILALELNRLDCANAQVRFPNLVLVTGSDAMNRASSLVAASKVRVARRMLRLIAAGEFESLPSLLALFEKQPFELMMQSDRSFGVFCERKGRHDFRSPEICGELGAVIRDRFRSLGHPPPEVNLRTPDQRIIGEIRGNEFYFGLDLAGELDAARTVKSEHHAPLNPTIAAAMLYFSDFFRTGEVLDPMVGSGTILREATAFPLNNRNKKKRLLGGEKFASIYERLPGLFNEFTDIDLNFYLGDAGTLEYLPSGSIPLVVTNPPYGIRISRAEIVDDIYRDFAKAAATKQIREVVGITSRKRSWSESMATAGYQLVDTVTVDYGGLIVWMMKHRLGASQKL